MREPTRTQTLLQIVHDLYVELQRVEPAADLITLDSRLDTELGFDSLGRVELQLRLERGFDLRLDEAGVARAATVGDLLRAIDVALGARRIQTAVTAATPGSSHLPSPTPSVSAVPLSAAPLKAATLLDVLAWRVQHDRAATHLVLLGDQSPQPLSYDSLGRQAARVAAGLQRLGIGAGSTVALMLPTSFEFFFGFFGVLLAGAIPVPIYPPASPSQLAEHVRRHALILENAAIEVLITVPEAGAVAQLLHLRVASLRRVVSIPELLAGQAGPATAPVTAGAAGATIAMLQYTSGSTGSPKGVILTHANLLANIRAMGAQIRADASDVLVSWLPLYHDMGLIGAWLGSLYFGCPLIIMSPLRFLVRPVHWLRAIHEHRGTISAAPNFAYELATQRIPDAELEGLDLSSWRAALNGAEPVSAGTIEHFQQRFGPRGFHARAMTPVYGMAEVAVGLTFPPVDRGPQVDCVDRAKLMSSGAAVPVSAARPDALRFVSCGVPLRGYQVRVVDEAGVELPERTEGALQFTGPSATEGYYRNAEATAQLKTGVWRNSGDRAYMADGEVYVTGRIKDIVIRRGRHLYPEEIERAIGELPSVRKGCVVAFGSMQHTGATEKLVVVAETHPLDARQRTELLSAINERVVACAGEPPDEIALAPPHSVLKTSSGKLRRAATCAAYEAGTLHRPPAGPARQLWQLSLESVRPLLRSAARRSARIAYGLYTWATFLLIAIPLVTVSVGLLNGARARRLTRRAARLLLCLWRIPLSAHDESDGALSSQHIVVVNHCSYVDSLVVAALLPAAHRFVANFRWQSLPLVNGYLRRLGTILLPLAVDPSAGWELQQITAGLADGSSLVVFPEGTFSRAAGLQRFHLGAFEAAVAANVPVIPVALRGARSLLRDGQALPSRVAVAVTIGAPLRPPAGSDPFAVAIWLQRAARAYILDHCGEPELQ